MLISLKIENGIKHHGRTFEFKPGLNVITGENEAGKSLIFEAIAFAFFGSQALRLPVGTYRKDMKVILEFEIKGQLYHIQRGVSNAVLLNNKGDTLAIGTKPVNSEIKHLLGYGFEVYSVSNYSAQESVQHLSTLKPTERKRLIDNVIGLTAIESVLSSHKTTLSEYRRVEKQLQNNPPQALLEINEKLEPEELEKLLLHLNEANQIKIEMLQAKQIIQNVENSKPTPMVKPEPFDPNFSLEQVKLWQQQAATMEKNISALGLKIHQFKEKLGGMDYFPSAEELNAAWQAYEDSQRKIKLINQGDIVCENCQHTNYFAGDSLKNLEKIPLDVPKPKFTVQFFTEYTQALVDHTLAITKLQEVVDRIPSQEVITKQQQLRQADQQYQNYRVRLEQYESAMEKLPNFSQEKLDKAIANIATYEHRVANKRQILNELEINKQRQIALDAYHKQWAEVTSNIEMEILAVKTLNDLLLQVKSKLLPSINAVASTWFNRMSDGKHTKIELTDSMEILANGQVIEALSISGRALGHLSLRMALGQVLTNSVFPVMMVDEVDSSMRNNRAQLVLDNLIAMLNQSVKQIIIITHQTLERIDHRIEV